MATYDADSDRPSSRRDPGEKPDNSIRQPLTGWALWWRVLQRAEYGLELPSYYKDSAFPACPACGSPNVMLVATRKGQHYKCLERNCRSHGRCEVDGSTGVERRKARVRALVVTVAFLLLVLVLALTGHLPNS